ncbi:MAG: hypothetical protein ACOYJD_06065 [Christensenellales bacterium]
MSTDINDKKVVAAEAAELEFDESICSAEFTEGCTPTVKEQE